jgi:hypothetical protein
MDIFHIFRGRKPAICQGITPFKLVLTAGLVDNAISHDPVTRFLSQQDFTSKELGKVIKKTVREIEMGEGVLIFDDTLQEKPHSAVKTSLVIR